MKRLTIGIPFYNAQETLRSAIQSVLAQTMTEWELILVNDGSTDASAEIARSIADPRVRLVGWPENRGLSWCLNEIGRMTTTRYLARMDADDLMHPERLERQVRFLDEHPGIDLVSCGAYIIDGREAPIGIRGEMPPPVDPRSLLAENRILHPAITGRSDWFRRHPYDPSFSRAEDHELWCRTCGGISWGHIPEALMFIRNAARREAGKYAESCRADRRIYRRYGPSRIGLARTAALLARGYAKPLVYSMMTGMGMEARLLRRRNADLTAQQVVEAKAVLRAIGEGVVSPAAGE